MKNNLLLRGISLIVILSTLFSQIGAQPGLAADFSAGSTPPPPSRPGDPGQGLRYGYDSQTGKLNFVGGDSDAPLVEASGVQAMSVEAMGASALAQYGPQFGLSDPAKELRVSRTDRSAAGSTVRYQQQFNGIPVMGGEMLLNTDARGNVLSLNGEISPGLSLKSVQPTVSAAQALQTALAGAQA